MDAATAPTGVDSQRVRNNSPQPADSELKWNTALLSRDNPDQGYCP
jgi:hypothetical protein